MLLPRLFVSSSPNSMPFVLTGLFLLLVTSMSGQAATKAEQQALSDQVASAERRALAAEARAAAAVVAANHDRDALQHSIAQLSAEAKKRSQDALAQRAAVIQESDMQADSNAALAQHAVEVAEQADAKAVMAAQGAKLQTDHLRFAIYTLLITNVFGFLVLLYKDLNNSWREIRQRKWVVEDKDRQEKLDAATEATRIHRIHELEQIAEVGKTARTAAEKAEAAYVEANTVNKKIESIGLVMKDGKPLAPSETEKAAVEKRISDKPKVRRAGSSIDTAA